MKNAVDHEEASRLLPWLVNGTLSGGERERVERHVHDCLACRAELREQHALRMLVQRHPDVHLSAEQGFAELARRLGAADGVEGAATGGVEGAAAADRAAASGARPRRAGPTAAAAQALRGLARGASGLARGASGLVVGHRIAFANALALAVVAGVAVWLGARGPVEAPAYSTLTQQPAREAELDIVFSPGTTQEAMHEVLADIGATIVDGPSAVGRYTVRLESGAGDAELDDAIMRLLGDPRVRFAGRAYISPGP